VRIRITPYISIEDNEIREEFTRAPGPGGQNVNKVSSAVRLRFGVRNSPSLGEDVRQRLTSIAGKRMTADGVLIVSATRFRTQERNRLDARDRLIELIRKAARKPAPRRRTKPTIASQARRLDEKTRHGRVKQLRGAARETD